MPLTVDWEKETVGYDFREIEAISLNWPGGPKVGSVTVYDDDSGTSALLVGYTDRKVGSVLQHQLYGGSLVRENNTALFKEQISARLGFGQFGEIDSVSVSSCDVIVFDGILSCYYSGIDTPFYQGKVRRASWRDGQWVKDGVDCIEWKRTAINCCKSSGTLGVINLHDKY